MTAPAYTLVHSKNIETILHYIDFIRLFLRRITLYVRVCKNVFTRCRLWLIFREGKLLEFEDFHRLRTWNINTGNLCASYFYGSRGIFIACSGKDEKKRKNVSCIIPRLYNWCKIWVSDGRDVSFNSRDFLIRSDSMYYRFRQVKNSSAYPVLRRLSENR